VSALQTLDRGLTTLGLIARAPTGISVAGLAEELGVARAIVYRIVATLEDHAMVTRDRNGLVHLGPAAALIASSFEPQLRHRAEPALEALAEACATTAFLSVAHGEHCTAIMVAEPRDAVIRVGYRTGSRHHLTVGAGGHAILALRPARPGEPSGVAEARRTGVAVSRGELERGASGVASGFLFPPQGGIEASVGVIALGDLDIEETAAHIGSAITSITA
jgi:DNA-binding IclR family transcriptional regulator